jgi:transcriptional regulator with GAF, ATPase, and Fis domain
VFPIEVPPLRQRLEDIAPLARHFLHLSCSELGREELHLTQQQVDCLGRHDWPGNIRELKNVIERAVILSGGRQLRLDLAMPEDEEGMPLARSLQSASSSADSTTEATFHTEAELRQQERVNMIAVLDAAGWRISGPGGAAELLGVKPSTLAYRMKIFAIEKSVEHLKDSNRI